MDGPVRFMLVLVASVILTSFQQRCSASVAGGLSTVSKRPSIRPTPIRGNLETHIWNINVFRLPKAFLHKKRVAS